MHCDTMLNSVKRNLAWVETVLYSSTILASITIMHIGLSAVQPELVEPEDDRTEHRLNQNRLNQRTVVLNNKLNKTNGAVSVG